MKNKTYKCDCCKKTFSDTLPFVLTVKSNFANDIGKRTLCSNCARYIASVIDMSDENVPSVSKPNNEKQTTENDNDSYDQNKINRDVPLGWGYSEDEEPFPVTGAADKWGYV